LIWQALSSVNVTESAEQSALASAQSAPSLRTAETALSGFAGVLSVQSRSV